LYSPDGVTCLAQLDWKSQIFANLLSFSALAQGDPFRIYEKALQILKPESSDGEDLVILARTIFE